MRCTTLRKYLAPTQWEILRSAQHPTFFDTANDRSGRTVLDWNSKNLTSSEYGPVTYVLDSSSTIRIPLVTGIDIELVLPFQTTAVMRQWAEHWRHLQSPSPHRSRCTHMTSSLVTDGSTMGFTSSSIWAGKTQSSDLSRPTISMSSTHSTMIVRLPSLAKRV